MNLSRYRLEAFGARDTFFSINQEVYRKIALGAIWIKKVPQCGAAAGNAFC